MITDTLQNELRERYNPDGSTLRRQQLRMLEMLQYIDSVCKNIIFAIGFVRALCWELFVTVDLYHGMMM